jgi:hypothetical protein
MLEWGKFIRILRGLIVLYFRATLYFAFHASFSWIFRAIFPRSDTTVPVYVFAIAVKGVKCNSLCCCYLLLVFKISVPVCAVAICCKMFEVQ